MKRQSGVDEKRTAYDTQQGSESKLWTFKESSQRSENRKQKAAEPEKCHCEKGMNLSSPLENLHCSRRVYSYA